MRKALFVLLCLIITSIAVDAQTAPIIIAYGGEEPTVCDCKGNSDALEDILSHPGDYTWIVDSQARSVKALRDVDGTMDLTRLDLEAVFGSYNLIVAIPKNAAIAEKADIFPPSTAPSGYSGIGQSEDTSGQAKVTTVSNQYKGYTIEVDGIQIGKEGSSPDTKKDGIYEFYVKGDMTHQIKVNLPQMDFRRWTGYYFMSDVSYTADIDNPQRIVSN